MFTAFLDNGSGEQLLYAPINGAAEAVFSPKLNSEINKADSFSFIIPPTNPMYAILTPFLSIVTVYDGTDRIFRGRVRDTKKTMNNCVTVSCESEIAWLTDIDIMPYNETATGATGQNHPNLADWVGYFMGIYNGMAHTSRRFSVIAPIDTRVVTRSNDNASNVYTELASLAEDYGLQMLCEPVSGGGTQITFDFLPTSMSAQTIEFGKNILSLEDYLDTDTFATRVTGINDDVPGSPVTYTNEDAERELNTVIRRIVNIDNVSSLDELKSFTIEEKNKRSTLAESITVNAIDLHLVDDTVTPFGIGQLYTFSSPPHGINTVLRCSKINRDLANPKNNKYVFGRTRKTLTEQIYKIGG